MSVINLGYSTKCRCCGHTTDWFAFPIGDFKDHHIHLWKAEHSSYPHDIPCDNCETETLQDVCRYFEYEQGTIPPPLQLTPAAYGG